MERIATILSDVRTQLEENVSELAYIDKDRGQLPSEATSAAWPCALLDVENVDYTQEGDGRQMADARIIVTVADKRLSSASQAASEQEEDAFRIFGLLEEVHRALHCFSTGGYAPLCRTNLKKTAADDSYECYKLTYRTAFEVGFDTGATSSRIQGIRLNLE